MKAKKMPLKAKKMTAAKPTRAAAIQHAKPLKSAKPMLKKGKAEVKEKRTREAKPGLMSRASKGGKPLTKPASKAERAQLTKTARSAQPARNAQLAKSAKPAKQAKAVAPIKQAKPVKPSKAAPGPIAKLPKGQAQLKARKPLAPRKQARQLGVREESRRKRDAEKHALQSEAKSPVLSEAGGADDVEPLNDLPIATEQMADSRAHASKRG